MVHENDVLLAGDLCVLHQPDNYSATGAEVFHVPRLVFACVDLGGDDVACSALAEHKTLDALLGGFVFDVLFDGLFLVGIMPSSRLSCRPGL